MKKLILTILAMIMSVIVVLTLIFLVFVMVFNSSYKKENNKFDYFSAKENTIKYLDNNKDALNEIVEKLIDTKGSIKNPTKEISFATYDYLSDFNFKEKTEYVIFYLDGQGMLGGQNYGIIYSKIDDEDFIVYDQKKVTGEGNNIFIREKLYDNWYFYYNDWDGEIDVNKIKQY